MRARATHRSAGFSTIELIVVMVIIAILIALAIPAFTSSKRATQVKALTAAAGQYKTAIEQYRLDNANTPPPTLPVTGPTNRLTGTSYLRTVPEVMTKYPGQYGINAGTKGRISYVRSGTINYRLDVYHLNHRNVMTIQCTYSSYPVSIRPC